MTGPRPHAVGHLRLTTTTSTVDAPPPPAGTIATSSPIFTAIKYRTAHDTYRKPDDHHTPDLIRNRMTSRNPVRNLRTVMTTAKSLDDHRFDDLHRRQVPDAELPSHTRHR